MPDFLGLLMDSNAQIDQLPPIIQSAAAPVVQAFDQAAMEARGASAGGSRAILAHQQVSTSHAHKLVAASWTALERALNKAHLAWDETTLDRLISVFEREVKAAAEPLYVYIRQKKASYPQLAEPAEKATTDALDVQLRGARAELALYVFDRRRREVLQLLAEIEQRVLPEADAAVLRQIADAKREAESTSGDQDQLKTSLEVLSITIQTLPTAYDLGEKLLKLLAWWPNP
jgi:hypothetical protein